MARKNRSSLLEPKSEFEVLRRHNGGVQVDIKTPEYTTYRLASGANLNRVLSQIDSNVDFLLITAFRANTRPKPGEPSRPRTRKENDNLFREVPKKLRADLGTQSVGAYWLVGHWTECSVPLKGKPISECTALGGEVVDQLEYSWLFTKPQEITGEQWLEAAIKIAKAYEQDAFVIRLDGVITLRLDNGTVDDTLSSVGAVKDAWENLASLRSYRKYFGYSELRKMREKGRRQPIVLLPEDLVGKELPKEGPEDSEEEQEEPTAKQASPYTVKGQGLPYTADFFVAMPHNISGKMMFASSGIERIQDAEGF